MSRPTRVSVDACVLQRRYLLDPHLLRMVKALDRWAEDQFARKGIRWPGLVIISGWRSREFQAHLNPDAPNSLHTRCPSLAVDLRVGHVAASIVGDFVWDWLGARWAMMGGRWGGRFSRRDENHFDLGVGHPATPELPPGAPQLPGP